MKRRIIKQGNNTLTITLPRKWARQMGLKAGDEIELVEGKEGLTIAITPPQLHKSIYVNVSAFKQSRIKHIVSVLYKLGYDEIKIAYTTKEHLEIIQEIVNRQLIGMEITELLDKKCVLHLIIKEEQTELENIFRRLFLTLLSFGEGYADLLVKGQWEHCSDLLKLEESINKLSIFFHRCVNKGLVEEGPLLKYLLAWVIESLGDCYRDLCLDLREQKINPKTVRRSLSTLALEVNKVVRQFYELYYHCTSESLFTLDQNINQLNFQLLKELAMGKESKDTGSLFMMVKFLLIIALVKEAVPTIISLRIDELMK